MSEKNVAAAEAEKEKKISEKEVVSEKKTEKKKGKKILVGLCVLCMLTTIVTLSYLLLFKKDDETKLVFEDNATMGIMPGVDLDQRRKELQAQLDKNMIAFSINTSPVFQSNTGSGNLMVENPGNNAKLISVKLEIAGTNEVVYTSNYIKPGSYLENITLDKILEPGTYQATAYFLAYTEDTAEYIGQTGAGIVLTVQ